MNINLFPVPIKSIKNFINKNEINKIISFIKNEKHLHHGSLKGKATSSHLLYKNIIKSNLFDLEKKLNLVIEEYSNLLGLDKQTINNSWSNIQKENSILEKHNHTTSPISGVLYLKVDEKSSKIYFYNPNPYIYIMDIKNRNDFNFEYVYFKPSVGDLILFPGWLMHGSNNEKNKSSERIVLSFNTIKK
jgi:uncharacterized protein (TIGR02466 family)